MRIIKVDRDTNGETLAARLSAGRGAREVLEALRAANPRVDLRAIKAGTVLFVPESVGSQYSDGIPLEQAGFDTVRAHVESSLEAAVRRIRTDHQTLAARGKAMTSLFRSAAFKRALDATPALKANVEAADEVFKEDQANAKTVDETFRAVQAAVARDFDRLAKMLR